MVQNIRVIPFQFNDAFLNMAIDEYFFRQSTSDSAPVLRFYGWKPSAATIGRNQSLIEEINIEYAKSHLIDFTRRITGGGAVFHSETGEITYMFVAPKILLEKVLTKLSDNKIFDNPCIPKYYVPIIQALIRGLERIGLTLDINKLHCPAIFYNGKKISGNAQAMSTDSVLQHGTILLSVDPEEMYSILKVPDYTTKKNIVLSVKAKVTSLNSIVLNKTSLEYAYICKQLIQGFSDIFEINVIESDLSNNERIEIEKIKMKYLEQDWIFKK